MEIISAGRGNTGRALQMARLGLGTLGVALAFLAAPAAFADETDPITSGAATVETTTLQAAAGEPSAPAADSVAANLAPAAPVSHLPSPDNLPPGTTDSAPQAQSRFGYLRDMWQAIRSEDVTMSDALLILAQRPLDANATPPSGVATGPTGPVGTSAPAAVVAPAAGADTP